MWGIQRKEKNSGHSSGLNLHCVLLNLNFDYLVHELVGYDLLVVSWRKHLFSNSFKYEKKNACHSSLYSQWVDCVYCPSFHFPLFLKYFFFREDITERRQHHPSDEHATKLITINRTIKDFVQLDCKLLRHLPYIWCSCSPHIIVWLFDKEG